MRNTILHFDNRSAYDLHVEKRGDDVAAYKYIENFMLIFDEFGHQTYDKVLPQNPKKFKRLLVRTEVRGKNLRLSYYELLINGFAPSDDVVVHLAGCNQRERNSFLSWYNLLDNHHTITNDLGSYVVNKLGQCCVAGSEKSSNVVLLGVDGTANYSGFLLNYFDYPVICESANLKDADPNTGDAHSDYEVRVYVTHGYFSYRVNQMSSALEHAHLIMERGVYRRSNDVGEVEFHKVVKVKVCGLGLASEYPDTFKRT